MPFPGGPKKEKRLAYRPEIDGLRAVAVVAVVLFHAGLPGFSGGYIGVDVFFVISGFLITSILLTELERGHFSLTGFYERRARRLLPALYVVILFCIPIAWATMLPDPLENFGQSIVATVFFGNNVLLYLTSGYWDLATEFKPLMHTWSLGVEEQFYLIFPLFLLLLWKYSRTKIFSSIFVVAFISLTLSTFLIEANPDANFYLAFTRLWELLGGSICAILLRKFNISSNSIVSTIGFLGIVGSIVWFDSNTPFPGPWALVPVVGAMLIILYGQNDSFVARLLSAKPVVGVGLISYSAYLWHQPLLALSRVSSRDQLGVTETVGVVVAVFALAYASWRYVELPFRKKHAIKRRVFIVASSIFGLVLISVGLYLHGSNGAPQRVFESQNSFERSSHKFKILDISNFNKPEFDEDVNVKFLVTGDSYAADAAYLLDHYYKAESVDIMLRDHTSCGVLEYGEDNPELSADIYVVAFDEGHSSPCSSELIETLELSGKEVFFMGTKHFGYNLNWITQIDRLARGSLCQDPQKDFLATHLGDKRDIPSKNYVSIMDPLSKNGCIEVTTPEGELISSDRKHLTIAGVEHVATKIFDDSNIDKAVRNVLSTP